MLGQKLVADVVKVADDRYVHAQFCQPLLDVRHCGGRFVTVDGNAHQLRAGGGKGGDLPRGRVDIGRIGVRHRLHDDGRAAADGDAADADCDSFVTLQWG